MKKVIYLKYSATVPSLFLDIKVAKSSNKSSYLKIDFDQGLNCLKFDDNFFLLSIISLEHCQCFIMYLIKKKVIE